jgi:hypothetical protein
MTGASIVSETLKLLGGELRDAAGDVVRVAAMPVIEVRDGTEARAQLDNGRRVAIAVVLSGGGPLARIAALCTARSRIAAAKRRLAAAGAGRIRALAVMSTADAVFLVYELGEIVQPYIEAHVVLQPRAAGSGRLARRAFEQVAGVSTVVDLVLIVGEAA